MPIKPTYPGVYIEEIPSGVRTITGVSTSIGLFVGRTKQGTLKKPTLCLNFTDFVRTFSADTTSGDMPRQVRLFFENGGTQCYVMRIANGATAATVTLKSEAGSDVLVLTAKNAGLVGETIRAAVSYSGPQPEATFNIELFRWETTSTGQLVKADLESWSNLTMDPASPRYAVDFLTQNSKLVDAAAAAVLPALTAGFSHSGRRTRC
ncbi:MAG: phage tail protein, partial [Syntrophobacteraceae bacterium]|nr:phage tail protein [Syntrophobacteraceae bacterium]